jgi:hypothetical protein
VDVFDVSETVVAVAALAIVIEPAPFVIDTPEPAVNVVRVNPVPFPMSKAPFAGVDVRPVPPLATATVPVTFPAVVAVDALPVKAPTKVVACNVPVEGVYLYFVELVYSDVAVPLVIVENRG